MAEKLCELKLGQRLELMVHEVEADGSVLFSGAIVSGLTVMATHTHLGGRLYQKSKMIHLSTKGGIFLN